MAVGKLAVYDNISIPLFISGCMLGMEAEKPVIRPFMANHLVEPTGDAKLYIEVGDGAATQAAALTVIIPFMDASGLLWRMAGLHSATPGDPMWGPSLVQPFR